MNTAIILLVEAYYYYENYCGFLIVNFRINLKQVLQYLNCFGYICEMKIGRGKNL